MSHSTRAIRVLPLVLVAPLLLSACASGDGTATPTPSVATSSSTQPSSMAVSTPTVSASSSASATPTAVATTSSASSTMPTQISSGSASASASATSKSSPSASSAAVKLPDAFSYYVKVESGQEGEWTLAGYSRSTDVIQVRAARTSDSVKTVLTDLVGAKGIDSTGYCGTKGKNAVCVKVQDGVTYALVSDYLMVDEIESLFYFFLKEV